VIWVIEESPTPGIWNLVQSRGIYKNPERARNAAKELQRWHRENLRPEALSFGWHFRATAYVPDGQSNGGKG
jgi:hypothetical protein